LIRINNNITQPFFNKFVKTSTFIAHSLQKHPKAEANQWDSGGEAVQRQGVALTIYTLQFCIYNLIFDIEHYPMPNAQSLTPGI